MGWRTIWVLLHPKCGKTSTVPLQKWTSMILSRKCANGCKWDRIFLLAYLCCAYLTSSFSALWGCRSPRDPPFCPLEPFQLPARHGDTWQLQFGTAMRNVTPNKATINQGNLRVRPQCHPAQEIRPCQGVMVSWWWIIPQKRPYFLGGWVAVALRGTLRFAWINMCEYQVLHQILDFVCAKNLVDNKS